MQALQKHPTLAVKVQMVQTWLEQNRPGKCCSGFMPCSCVKNHFQTSEIMAAQHACCLHREIIIGLLVGHVCWFLLYSRLAWLQLFIRWKSLIFWCYCNAAELMQSCRWEWSTQWMCDAVMLIIVLFVIICPYMYIWIDCWYTYIYTVIVYMFDIVW